MTLVSLAGLLACLDVTEDEPGRWSGANLDFDYRRIFGGQLVAQAIAIATASAPDRAVKSLSCLFPREGATDVAVAFELEESQTGRTFAARRLRATQLDKTIFLAQISLAVGETGPEHQDPPPDVGSPEGAAPQAMGLIPWETRVVGAVDLADPAPAPADYAFWMRVTDAPLGESLVVHQALLAYATDLTVIGTALRPLAGSSQADANRRLHTAVTSHTVWFHRPFRLDDWCLVSQHVPAVGGARAFGHGHVFDARSDLVASFAQESMVRPIDVD